MRRGKSFGWFLAAVLVFSAGWVTGLHSQMPSAASVFLGWLEKADCVQIHLPNQNIVSYGGEKLEQVVLELNEWEKKAE